MIDLGVSDRSAHEALKLLSTDAATRKIPAAVMSAEVDRPGVVKGLVESLGATLFLEGPSLVRLRQEIRHAIAAARAQAKDDDRLVERGRIRVSLARHRVWVLGRLIEIPHKRFEVLRILLSRQGMVPTLTILAEGWAGGENPGVVAKTVQRLRKDLRLPDDAILSSREGYHLIG